LKKLLFISSLLLSNLVFADIDLSQSYSGDIMAGYSGIGASTNYIRYSTNKKIEDLNFLDYKYSYIDSLNKQLANTLENDNKEIERIIIFDYTKFKFERYDPNIFSILLGISNSHDNKSRAGFKLSFGNGRLNDFKERDYSGQLFYNLKYTTSEFNFIGFLGKSEIKKNEEKEKGLYYGIFGKYRKNVLDKYIGYFDYLEPSFFIDTTIQRYNTENRENNKKTKINNSSINSTLGLEGNKDFIIDDISIKASLKTGYNREFLEKKKYKFFNKKEDSKDNIIGELGVTLTYNDFIGFNTSYQIKKSLNTSDYIDRVEIGVKFKF
jgi:hypothetical protein